MLSLCFLVPQDRAPSGMEKARRRAEGILAEAKLKVRYVGTAMPLRKFLTDDYEPPAVDDPIRVQGRELLAHLHSEGLLIRFYEAYRKDCAEDPSGVRTFEALLGRPLDEIEKAWRKWLMAADGEIGSSAMAKPFPVLGILIQRKRADDAQPGVGVFHACPGTPAERAGLKDGDRILEIDGMPVGDKEELIRFLQKQS
ncbi:MAG: PDZ domain-containing protein [Planctomycetes bacterium]|nr:PDZ domain-containing protein [Planctomycetota bacterium]